MKAILNPERSQSAWLKSLKERRQYYRHDTDLTAFFRKEETDDFTPARIINISVAGAYLRPEKPLSLGKRVELSFQLPGQSRKTISCLVKVHWIAKFKGYHGGVEFVDLTRLDRYRIAGFIRTELRKKGLENFKLPA